MIQKYYYTKFIQNQKGPQIGIIQKLILLLMFFQILMIKILIIKMTSLQKQLNKFIFSSVSDEDLITTIKKQYPPNSNKHLLETRSALNLSQKEQQRQNAQKYYDGFKFTRKSAHKDLLYKSLDMVATSMGLTLNTGAFLVSIQLLGDEQQVKYWRQQVLQGKVIGAYGQTQLGHGSNVKQLETTAIFNKQTDSFIINSQKNTSAKFWPGVLGQYGTHSVIQAKTIVQGKYIGVQTFVVQVRDANLQPVKNVDLFDIGPKLGFERVDNGGLSMKNLQIPRNAMLMRYIKISKDGKIEGLQNTQAIKYGYGSMLNLRVKLTYSFAIGAIISPSIALHQVLHEQGVAEELHNKKYIINNLTLGYGIIIANKNTHNIFNSFLKEISNKNFSAADKHLINCHIISSTFKALSSRLGINTVSKMQTFTNLGKFRTSFMPYYFYNYAPSTTYEGDNTVLLQQTSKFLLFKFNTDKKIENLVRQFKNNDWKAMTLAIHFILIEKLKKTKLKIEALTDKGTHFQTIWNELQQNTLIGLSTLWGYLTFLQSIQIILPTIKQNREFYTKICQGFTEQIGKEIGEFELYDFKIIQADTWKTFTDQQVKAMIQINLPIQKQLEPMRLIQREEKWLQPRL